ncbi:hypothetical protein NUSPORA_01973 [Nucleospora cyclopteri]
MSRMKAKYINTENETQIAQEEDNNNVKKTKYQTNFKDVSNETIIKSNNLPTIISSDLEQEYKNLQEEVETQKVIIEALITQIKILTQKLNQKESNEEVKLNTNEIVKKEISVNPKIIQDKSSEQNEIEEELSDDFKDLEIQNLSKEICKIFKEKKPKLDFKDNFSLKQFVEWAESSFDFRLENRTPVKIKNPLRMYVVTNLDKIIKHLMDNLNIYSLNAICSTFFAINREMEEKHKLVVCLDIILVCKERTKLLYILCAIYNNVFPLETSPILQTISSIAYHQYCIDTHLYKDKTVLQYLESIKANFGLFKQAINLFDLLEDFINKKIDDDVIDFSKGTINNTILTYAFCTRAVCHVLDWDFTYNQVLVKKLNIAENSFHTLIAILLGINAFNCHGMISSVRSVFSEFVFVMKDTNEVSLLCYIFLKQIYKNKTEEYLEFFKDKIGIEKLTIMNEILLF